MTDKKPTKTRRPVTPARLHKAITEFCNEYNVVVNDSVDVLLDSIRDVWFVDAQKN